MQTFLPKCFGGSRKSHTFASAFENERDLKHSESRLYPVGEYRKCSLKRFT